MEARGELQKHNLELQKKTRGAVERPKPVESITKARATRVFYFDPTYILKEDLKDHLGNSIYAKGTKINPLETVSLSQDLVFFDGDDEEQKKWLLSRIQDSESNVRNNKIEKIRLILIKGSPLELSKELSFPVYFDQGGYLTKKLGIQHVPAVVTQDKLRLRIEEIFLTGAHK